jgi:DNA invertase Pin-like site-specific DNA recombinase
VLVGYARVSTPEQRLDLQRDALVKAGCERVFEDVASGAQAERPGLAAALAFVRPGDTLAVWRLDRLGRSLPHLIEAVTALRERGVGFRSLQESLDTTTSGGKLVFHVFAALAEFERDLIRERTSAGLAAARARGRRGGRPSVMTAHKARVAQEMYRSAVHRRRDRPDAWDQPGLALPPPRHHRLTCGEHVFEGFPLGDSLLVLRIHQRTVQQGRGSVHGADVCRLPGGPWPWQRSVSGHDPS